MIDNIFTQDSFLKKVNNIASGLLCAQVKASKKGRIRNSDDTLELAFIRMITPVISRKKQLEIDCYLTKKY